MFRESLYHTNMESCNTGKERGCESNTTDATTIQPTSPCGAACVLCASSSVPRSALCIILRCAQPPELVLRRSHVGPGWACPWARGRGQDPHFRPNLCPGGRPSGRLNLDISVSEESPLPPKTCLTRLTRSPVVELPLDESENSLTSRLPALRPQIS